MCSSDGNRSSGKGYRPSSYGDNSTDRRLFHPATVEEIKHRVEILAEQFKKSGRFTRRLPPKGSGQSA